MAETNGSSSPPTGTTGSGTPEPPHAKRMITFWLIISLVVDVLYYTLAGPHMPPGDMTSAASGAQFDLNILMICALPVILGVWTYLGYALYNFREGRPGTLLTGPMAHGNFRLQVGWMVGTTVLVLGLFVFGTAELIIPAGAGGGEGPDPIWTPTSHTVLPIQVIGQQWKWTYRYPTYGGFETTSLVIPDNTTIAFHVTSLDVIHDFWAYQLGIKADANPQQDNVAFTTTHQLGQFTVRCDELCGLWHGAMYGFGHVVTKAAFAAWATRTEAQLAANTKLLPPFQWTYVPDANGADGGYYPDNVDPYSKVEIYGAQKAKV